MRRMRLFPKAVRLAAIAPLFVSTGASATCTYLNGESPRTYTYTVPPLTFSRDTAVGTVLYTQRLPAQPPTVPFASCSGGGVPNRSVTGGAMVTSNPYTFATNVPGVGVRFYDAGPTGTGYRYWGAGNQQSFNGNCGWSNEVLGLEVVATGQIGSGTIDGSTVATFSLDGLLISTLQITPFPVTGSSCSVNTQNITVKMPTVNTSAL
ncbi:hypothetical protein BVER_01700 [Candidatus Burkholderia verschuerenii]|uniref:MrkD-like receptor binding domain-containing protein n=2 Tax=Candidatus Burkholderia verschuerenii TaxID=242163 RepID=A0A0L0MJI9_9BURK|nr:hypothetical protein BVER_01700 [Candidatus Burkholderia verschuerenii]